MSSPLRCVILLLTLLPPLFAQARPAPACYIPENVDLYLDVHSAEGLVRELSSAPWVTSLRETGLLEEIARNDFVGRLQDVFSMLAETTTGRVGASLRQQPAGPRFLVVSRRRKDVSHDDLLKRLIACIPGAEMGDEERVDGHRTTALGSGGFAADRDGMFLWSSHPFHLRRALRLNEKESLAETARYRALDEKRGDAQLAACLASGSMIDGKDLATEEPLAIVLFQGLLDDLRATRGGSARGRLTPWPAFEIDLEVDRSTSDWMVADRHHAWVARREGDIAHLHLDRDLGLFWRNRHDILPESAEQGLAEFSQAMNTFLAGFAFDDIVDQVAPGAQLVVAPQRFPGNAMPDLRLPSFALVLATKLTPPLRDRMRVAFQTAIGVINASAAEENRQPMLQFSRMVDDIEVLCTRVLDHPRDGRRATAYNFSPSLAFVDSTMILSSTAPLAEDLVARMKSGQLAKVTGDHLVLEGEPLVRALRLNSTGLAEQMMLEDGIELDEAEARVDLLTRALSRVTSLDIRHQDRPGGSRWKLAVRGREEPSVR